MSEYFIARELKSGLFKINPQRKEGPSLIVVKRKIIEHQDPAASDTIPLNYLA